MQRWARVLCVLLVAVHAVAAIPVDLELYRAGAEPFVSRAVTFAVDKLRELKDTYKDAEALDVLHANKWFSETSDISTLELSLHVRVESRCVHEPYTVYPCEVGVYDGPLTALVFFDRWESLQNVSWSKFPALVPLEKEEGTDEGQDEGQEEEHAAIRDEL